MLNTQTTYRTYNIDCACTHENSGIIYYFEWWHSVQMLFKKKTSGNTKILRSKIVFPYGKSMEYGSVESFPTYVSNIFTKL